MAPALPCCFSCCFMLLKSVQLAGLLHKLQNLSDMCQRLEALITRAWWSYKDTPGPDSPNVPPAPAASFYAVCTRIDHIQYGLRTTPFSYGCR